MGPSDEAARAIRPPADPAASLTRDRSVDATLGPEEGPADAPREGAGVPSVLGRYEVLGLLGRGGMGEVYEARDALLGRPTALKFIRGAGTERGLRLLQEARAQARIDHPNVCKVYEAGEFEGRPYIAMQLVRGRRLDEAAASMTLAEKAKILREIAEAVHEAHRLGVIHRDLKPSNVLVVRGDDGHYTPTVMDFGLAYEVQRGHGLTETWALVGTPSYMAPEQARGDARRVDRRSDVYSLGATLYELLGGAPPFAAASAVETLHEVLHGDPPRLRAHLPRAAADLETIALKCLEKDPDRRYPSALSLAQDLGRFLAGEPILGRRPGLAERLGRAARRHRALAALAAVSLATTLALGGFGVRSRLEARRAQERSAGRARLAQDLGQQAKEVEWFLHAAHALPLHDTTRERAYVRERMAEIERRGREAGELGGGLAHYALGRGHLALGEFDRAYDELSLARAQGVDSPELDYTLGRALGELYRRAVEAARRGGGREWARARQQAAEAQYLRPALAALERGRAVKAESPLYLEGLIALYRRDYDAAARSAERATAETPWAYEARKLSGDAAFARAEERLERGDYEPARAGFDEAVALYERALEFARSEAPTHEALAAAWLERSELDRRLGGPRRQSLERARAAADAAIVADPHRASAHTRRAYVLMNRYKLRRVQGADDAELAPALAEWVATATRAVELDPNDPHAYDVLGLGHVFGALQEVRVGRDPMPAWGRAVAWLGAALEVEPDYPWGLNDLAVVHLSRGTYLADRARDPRDEYAEAERLLREALRSDPTYLFAYANLGDVLTNVASYELTRGLSPEDSARRALEAAEQAFALDPHYYNALNQAADAELARAEYLEARGEDPRDAVARALGFVDRSLAVNGDANFAWLHRAHAHGVAARRAVRGGEDPSAALEAGLRALDEDRRRSAASADNGLRTAELRLIEAEWARRQGRDAAPALARALAGAKAAIVAYPHADAYRALARVYLDLAEARPAPAAPDPIAEGLAQAEAALRLAPDMAEARAVRGGLLLARARTARDAKARLADARLARAELERALALDPLLRRDVEGPLREAEALGAQSDAAPPFVVNR